MNFSIFNKFFNFCRIFQFLTNCPPFDMPIFVQPIFYFLVTRHTFLDRFFRITAIRYITVRRVRESHKNRRLSGDFAAERRRVLLLLFLFSWLGCRDIHPTQSPLAIWLEKKAATPSVRRKSVSPYTTLRLLLLQNHTSSSTTVVTSRNVRGRMGT
jgi:hypothetical protein